MTTTCPSDDELLRFLNHRLDDSLVANIDSHIDTCEECAETIAEYARLESTDPDSPTSIESVDGLRRGDTLDRYLIIDIVGSGGMGWVYAAYDPELDRKVALKVLKLDVDTPDDTDITNPENTPTTSRKRLLREARSLAALSHPNVTTVHDAGTSDGRFYLAVEFIEGVILREWLRVGTRSVSEILNVFLPAGQALAAAHEAGIVHRDFKPENVLVDYNDVVRVTDFGLARNLETSSLADAERVQMRELLESLQHGDDIDVRETAVTRTGMLVGTPAYMSPEQLSGHKADARSDQFSFCVALYEALYTVRPFAARDLRELREVVASGVELPSKSQVPLWLGRVLKRGLSPKPEDRYPDMSGLLAALAEDPQSKHHGRLKTVGSAAALCALAGLVTYGVVSGRTGDDDRLLCTTSAEDIRPIWNTQRKTRLRRVFSKLGTTHASEVERRLQDHFDDYTTRWSKLRDLACTDTRIRKLHSREILEQRMHCFERTKLQVESLLDNIESHADAKNLDDIIRSTVSLPSVSDCNDLARTRFPLPDDAKRRAQIVDLEHKVARMQPKRWVDADQVAKDQLDTLIEKTRAVGYPPLLSRALQLQWEYLFHQNDYVAATRIRRLAAHAASLAKDDYAVARWAIIAVKEFMYEPDFAKLGFDSVVDNAWAAIARAGDTSELKARLHRALGKHYGLYKDNKKQRTHLEAAREGFAATGTDIEAHAGVMFDLAKATLREGDEIAALDAMRVAYRQSVALFGETSPRSIRAAGEFAYLDGAVNGNVKGAIAKLEAWLALETREFRHDHPNILRARIKLASTLEAADELERAEAEHKKLLQPLVARFGAVSIQVGQYYDFLSTIYLRQNRRRLARDTLRTAISVISQLDGISREFIVGPYNRLATMAAWLGDIKTMSSALESAKVIIRKGVNEKRLIADHHHMTSIHAELRNDFKSMNTAAITWTDYVETHWGPDNKLILPALQILADSHRLLKQPAKSLPLCKRLTAIAARVANGDDHLSVADAHACTGKALLALGRAKEALSHLERAYKLYQKLDQAHRPLANTESFIAFAQVLRSQAPSDPRLGRLVARLKRLKQGETPRALMLRRQVRELVRAL